MNLQRVRFLAGALVVAMIAAGCGGGHGSSAQSSATTAGSGSTAPSSGGSTKFGTLDSPCGPGNAKGATANGVTDTSITFGYGDDSDYPPAPGLTREQGDAVKAMIGWCNDQGGINGRKLVGNYYDAKLLQVTQVMTQACNDKVFMLVGQGWALDAGQESIRIGCKLSTVPSYSVSTAFAMGSGMVQPTPNPGDQVPLASSYQLAQLFPDAVKKVALVYAKYPPTQETRDKYVAGYPQAGWSFLNCDQIYNIAGESDWKPFAANMKACGAQGVAFIGSPVPNLENLLVAAKQVGFSPQFWFGDGNNYDESLTKWNTQNGNAGDTFYVREAYVPFELAGQVPAVQQYLDLAHKNGSKVALLGEQATSSFLLWAVAAKACGSNLTPKCVLDQAGKQNGWTAGGLQTPSDPGANAAPTCGMLLKLQGGSWVKSVPTGKIFDCNAKYAAKGLTTSALTAAKVGSDRIATQFGTFTP